MFNLYKSCTLSMVIVISSFSMIACTNTKSVAIEQANNIGSVLLKEAQDGSAKAQYELGQMYFEQKGAKQDITKAIDLFTKSANQNYAEAQFYLGSIYFFGLGIEPNDDKAFQWFKKASDQGHIGAKTNLAAMYLKGKGVLEDKIKARNMFKELCDSGNEVGCLNYQLTQ